MDDDIDIEVDHVSKKYCKSLKRSMRYGVRDISRNMLRLSSHPSILRQDEFWALDDVSFDVQMGETLGLIGPNGSGKTTLLKMLNGIFRPDRGKIAVRGRVGALIEVGAGFHPSLTGRENIYVSAAILGMGKSEVNEKFDSIVEFAEVGDFIDAPVKHYSSGMYVRLGFAVAVHCEPDILLVDEVLAVGDTGFQLKCMTKIGELKDGGMSTVLVSHNMNHASTFSDRVVLVNHGKAAVYDQPFEAIKAYNRLFIKQGERGFEEILTGNEDIEFHNITHSGERMCPGDSFTVVTEYTSKRDYKDAIVDVYISSDDSTNYFQATNKAYNKLIDLHAGSHELQIKVENIPISHATATIELAVYSNQKKEALLFLRFPAEFAAVDHSTGNNFLNVVFKSDGSVEK